MAEAEIFPKAPYYHSYVRSSLDRLWSNEAKDYNAEWLRSAIKDCDRSLNDLFSEASLKSVELMTRDLFEFAEAGKELFGSVNIKYQALEIYKRFILLNRMCQRYKIIKETKEKDEQTQRLRRLDERLEDQAPLRACTCLAIASKIAGSRSITIMMERWSTAVKDLLHEFGFSYSVEDVVTSELTVLEQLQFKCSRTSALDLLELLLISLALRCNLGVDEISCQKFLEKLYGDSIAILDASYLNFRKVYTDLYFIAKGIPEILPCDRAAFSRVTEDRVLLVGAVLIVSMWRCHSEAKALSLANSISLLTGSNLKDLINLARCVMPLPLGNKVQYEDQDDGKRRLIRERKASLVTLLMESKTLWSSDSDD